METNFMAKIPGSRYEKIPLLKAEDKALIKDIAIKHRFDYLAVPGVQTGKDILDVKDELGKEGAQMHVIAKIDTMESIQNFTTIIKQADGVVLLRNELQPDMEPEKLVIAQKWMIQTANSAAVPVFLQSQILESMVGSPDA